MQADARLAAGNDRELERGRKDPRIVQLSADGSGSVLIAKQDGDDRMLAGVRAQPKCIDAGSKLNGTLAEARQRQRIVLEDVKCGRG